LGRHHLLTLPNNIIVKYEGHVGDNKRSFSYVSSKATTDMASAVITCSQDRLSCHGQASNDNGDTYVLEYCGDEGHVWKQYSDDLDDRESEDAAVWAGDSLGGGYEDDDEEEDNDIDLTTHVEYSVKFYFTTAFFESTRDIDGFIDQIVTKTNLAYINSKVPLSAYALCKEEAVGLEEVEDTREMLAAFTDFKASVEELRDTADAAVLLITDFQACGIGYIADFKKDKGFTSTLSVVSKSCAQRRYTLAHELGHNFGLAHDPDHAKTLPYPFGTGHLIERGISKVGMSI
jgi:hypothetical protein